MKEDYTEINSVCLFCRSFPLGSLVFAVEVMVHTYMCSDLLDSIRSVLWHRNSYQINIDHAIPWEQSAYHTFYT